MITDQLDAWKVKKEMFGCEIDEDLFSIFFQEQYIGKSFMEIMCDLAYAIHELEVCVDGLIEDVELVNGQIDKKR